MKFYLKLPKMKFITLVFLCVSAVVYTNGKGIGSRIIGGRDANAGEFPSAAAVYIHTSNARFFCGGALISDQYILTAAQCVDGALSFTVSLGSHLLSAADSNRVTVAAEEYIVNPNYDAFTLKNDIALIKLRTPVQFSDYLKPIELPTEPIPDHAVVVAIGWGQTSDDDSATAATLNRVSITAFTNEECRLTYGVDTITDEMVCAEGNYNEGTCHGDSGSPLIRFVHSTEAVHVAVSSFFSANGCESTDPSGFTRTYPYVDWIRNVTGIL